MQSREGECLLSKQKSCLRSAAVSNTLRLNCETSPLTLFSNTISMYFCIAWSFLTYKPPLHFSKQALIVESKRVHKKTASFLVTFHLVDIFHWWEAPPLEKNGISHQSNSTNVRNFKNLDRFWSTLFPFGDDFMMWLLLLYVTFLIVIWIWRQLWALCRNALGSCICPG